MSTKPDIKFLVLDVDGVLTDGSVYISEQGDDFRRFNTKDGLAIRRLNKSGFPVGIISHSLSINTVKRRAEMLLVERCYVGLEPKLGILKGWLQEMQLKPEQVAYIGDDLNDLEVFDFVGFTACPADAAGTVQEKADVVLQKEGGRACVREFIETYLGEYL